MAGKCKEMNKIKQALRLHLDGESNRSIGRKLDLYKGTVNKYINMAESCGIPIPVLLAMEEPEIERVLTGGNPAYSDSRFQELKERLPYIASELERKHMTLFLLWREYRMSNPDGYGYTQFCYHVNQYTEAQKPSFVLSPDREGGQYLFVDFAGDTMSYVDLETGEEVKCQVFVASLPASDYGFAMAVRSQTVDDFLYAIECCLRHIGGVPKIIVTDNLKSAVVKADRYEPEINRSLEDFAEHFGCVTIPARSGKPKDKALVENHVKLTYQNVYAPLRNHQFFSIEELNAAIAEQMMLHNQRRMQRLPFTREERFISIDKPALKSVKKLRSYTRVLLLISTLSRGNGLQRTSVHTLLVNMSAMMPTCHPTTMTMYSCHRPSTYGVRNASLPSSQTSSAGSLNRIRQRRLRPSTSPVTASSTCKRQRTHSSLSAPAGLHWSGTAATTASSVT